MNARVMKQALMKTNVSVNERVCTSTKRSVEDLGLRKRHEKLGESSVSEERRENEMSKEQRMRRRKRMSMGLWRQGKVLKNERGMDTMKQEGK